MRIGKNFLTEGNMQHHAATGAWTQDWLWGLALIVASAVLHAFGLMVIAVGMRRALDVVARVRALRPLERFAAVIAATSLTLVLLHGLEAAVWASMLVWLGACANFDSAIYFSLQMATTLGTDVVQLADHWKLMGPLEGISGMLMFGLSTAFLFAVMQRAWPFPERKSG
jgi:hypothetical protein